MSKSTTHFVHTLLDIGPQWWRLFARCPDATPFQSPSWLVPWWHCFGQDHPLVVAVHRAEDLVGLGLFYCYDGSAEGPQLFFVGKSASDYLDLLIAPEESRQLVTQQIFHCLLEQHHAWQIADLDRLRENSSLLQLDAPGDVVLHRSQEGICPELELTGTTMKGFLKKSTRDQLRKHRNRAATMGTIEYISADEDNLSELIGELVHLHNKRWNSAGQPGVFADSRMVRFISAATPQLMHSGMLRLHSLRLNGAPVAVSFGMLHRDRLYFYLCDFDPDYASIFARHDADGLRHGGSRQARREVLRFHAG